MDVKEITKAIEQALADAYARGFEDGRTEVTRSVYLAVASVLPPTAMLPTSVERVVDAEEDERHEAEENRSDKARIKRAPKGLTQQVIHRVLDYGFGLPMEDVQRRAVEMDSRVSAKTVYNELYRRTHLYEKDANDHWRLRRSDGVSEEPSLIDVPEEHESEELPIAAE